MILFHLKHNNNRPYMCTTVNYNYELRYFYLSILKWKNFVKTIIRCIYRIKKIIRNILYKDIDMKWIFCTQIRKNEIPCFNEHEDYYTAEINFKHPLKLNIAMNLLFSNKKTFILFSHTLYALLEIETTHFE